MSQALCGAHRPCFEGEHDVVQVCSDDVPFSAMPPWLHLPVAGVCRAVGAQVGGLLGPGVARSAGAVPPAHLAQATRPEEPSCAECEAGQSYPAQRRKRRCPAKTTPSPPAEGIIKDCW